MRLYSWRPKSKKIMVELGSGHKALLLASNLFNFMDLSFSSQFKLISQSCHFQLMLCLQLCMHRVLAHVHHCSGIMFAICDACMRVLPVARRSNSSRILVV